MPVGKILLSKTLDIINIRLQLESLYIIAK